MCAQNPDIFRCNCSSCDRDYFRDSAESKLGSAAAVPTLLYLEDWRYFEDAQTPDGEELTY